jgi:antitoxin VapB
MPEDHPTAKAERSEELAERVGFGLRPVVENKELTGFPLPPDPPEPLESRDGRTYCARGAIYQMYMAYWLREVADMSRTAKVFMTNRSQAVRLPKEFQFATAEVLIRRVGDDVILSPRPRDWKTYLTSAPVASATFMADVDDLPLQERDL